MTKKRMNAIVAGLAALSVAVAGAVLAADKPSQAVPKDKRAVAQENAGHAGTHGGAGHGAMAGMRHGNGHPGMADGHAGKGGMKHGAMGTVSMLLNHLEKLDGKNAAADFDLTRHSQADADGDGRLSAEEWTGFAVEARPRLLARLLKLAPQADANQDGKLSRSELKAFRVERDAKLREHALENNPDADANGDGVLSKAEFKVFMAKRAEQHLAMILKSHPQADVNGDGALSKDEAHAFRRTGAGDGGCPFANGKGGECPFASGKGH